MIDLSIMFSCELVAVVENQATSRVEVLLMLMVEGQEPTLCIMELVEREQ